MSDLNNIPPDVLYEELSRGGRIVVYSYCISVIFMSFQRTSDPVLVRADESAALKSWPYTLLTLCLGWWGFPFGLLFTPLALVTNLRGGEDVTDQLYIR